MFIVPYGACIAECNPRRTVGLQARVGRSLLETVAFGLLLQKSKSSLFGAILIWTRENVEPFSLWTFGLAKCEVIGAFGRGGS